MEPQIIIKPSMDVIGFQVRTNNANELNPGTAKIPGLWQKFFTQGMAAIPNKANDNLFGVYTEYESNEFGDYTLIVGCPVSDNKDIPDNMTSISIPESKYLMFELQGEMPQAIVDGWGVVWQYFKDNTEYKRIYTADYECYHTSAPNRAEIYIAVE